MSCQLTFKLQFPKVYTFQNRFGECFSIHFHDLRIPEVADGAISGYPVLLLALVLVLTSQCPSGNTFQENRKQLILLWPRRKRRTSAMAFATETDSR